MSKKGKTIAAVVFLVSAVLLFGVLANSHIQIFPGTITEYDYILEMEVTGREMISLLDHRRPDDSSFTAMGYVVAVLVILGLPALAGYFAGKKFGDK